ncbi:MAG: C39 family peptidase [Euryarchaeota archaeon]|nr:C39 family peptidase [Euryarchaeota archaeon]
MKARTKPKGIGMAAMMAAIITVLLIAAASAPASAATNVSIDDAETVASFYVQYVPTFIDNYSEWQEATVEQSTVYHDLDCEKSAYAFDVIENGQYAGYILVSATRDNYPILEFSTGRTPDAITELTTRSETLAQERADENGLTAGEAKPLYLGATFYYAKYPLIDDRGEIVDRVVVDLTVPVIVDLDVPRVELPMGEKDLLEKQQMRKQEANTLWDALEEKMKTTSLEGPASSRGLGWISDVPAYLWRCGCAPTAAGMVLGYWDSHGYPNFPGETTLIDELAVAMHTGVPPRSPGGTYNSDVAPGIEEVCDNHGYSDFDAQLKSISWNRVKEEVDASRPFVLHMQQGGTGSGHSQPYGDHSVTGLGYSDYDEDYVFIHDTWDEHTHTIAYDNWDSAEMTRVIP